MSDYHIDSHLTVFTKLMRRKQSKFSDCPVAQGLDEIGDPWSILILRDALQGTRRFDEFQRNLQIAPTILTRRLKALVDHQLLEKQQYCEHPPREEYLLTQKGRDFQAVLVSLSVWSNKHCNSSGKRLYVVDVRHQSVVKPVLVDEVTGEVVSGPDYQLLRHDAASKIVAALADEVSPAETSNEHD